MVAVARPCGPECRGARRRTAVKPLRKLWGQALRVDSGARGGGPERPVGAKPPTTSEGTDTMHANDLFAQITDQLIADIESGATGTWRMPWHTLADSGTPASVDGRPYRGANALWLAMVAAA